VQIRKARNEFASSSIVRRADKTIGLWSYIASGLRITHAYGGADRIDPSKREQAQAKRLRKNADPGGAMRVGAQSDQTMHPILSSIAGTPRQ
jgi:hypothetical protein